MPSFFTAFTQSAGGLNGGETLIQRLTGTPIPGTLNVQSVNITTDTSAGFKLAELECGWDSASSAHGVFSSGYLSGQAAIAASLKAAGYQVVVSAGIFYYPSWLPSYIGSTWQYQDQAGNGSSSPNFMWNPAVRAEAAAYISQLTAAMVAAGVDVDYYRIGIAPSGEMMLPAINTGSGALASGGWWAFDAIAQGSAGGLPAGISTCPYPGWVPGTTTGGTLTTLQATAWWNWYMGAVNNAHQWEIDAHRAGGWSGATMLCIPGLGASPDIIRQRLAASPPLSASPADYLMNIAAAWHLVIPALASPLSMVVDISSVLDGSGGTVPSGFGGNTGSQTGANNVTGPLDDTMILTSTSGPCADFYYSHWSATRWISYLARANGLKCLGENPGDDGTHYTQSLATQVAPAMAQAYGCGLYSLMWANDIFMAQGGAHGYATPSQVITGFNTAF